ncbi:AI-2E family transporter [Spirosoma pollinicola]|uniref:AI-2E family transporter n=1 Tax=Spirosoma pollinicola TaxID=2057025 RepID=A0A2K8Z7S2_9BACT|nr:AI-2E family transporter [Spirosoma pollinicola]AUD05900.1 AI-2E family transporter [Spirosoma pollinicola]RYF65954.1 MAG: AI-2E family transporter [Cytophagaceae bacterium]
MEHPTRSFAHRVATAAFISLLVAALFLLAGYAAHFFFLVFGGIIVAVVISGLSHFVGQKTSLSYGLSLGVVMLLLVGLIGGTIWLLAPTVSQQADQLGKSLPQSIRQLKTTLSQTAWGQKIQDNLPDQPGELLSSGGPGKGVLTQITGIFSSTLGGLVNVLIVIITGIYLASNPGNYRKGFARLFAPSYRERLLGVMDQCYDTLKNWFISRTITMTVVGVVTGAGLALLGIPFAIVLGIIAGILNFIPNLGPYIALAPALLVALPQGVDHMLYVFALYMGVQSLEGYILTPLLDKKFVSVPPAMLLFAQVLLGILVGLAGVLFASPLVAVLLVVVNELYVKDRLEKQALN